MEYLPHIENLFIISMPRSLLELFSTLTLFWKTEDNFVGVSKLTYFRADNCVTREIPYICASLPNLKMVELSHSTVIKSDHGVNSGLCDKWNKLETLVVYDTEIVMLEIPVLESLKNMTLCRCAISYLENYQLKKFPVLEVLDLSGNKLHSLDPETFFLASSLKSLDLSQNNLQSFPVLRNCSLNLLNLTHNLLDYVENLGAFGTTVNHLDMSDNKISDWSNIKLFSLSESDDLWVNSMNLSNNLLDSLSKVMMESLNGLQVLDLGGNRFQCSDCRLIPFQKWLNTTSINITNLGTTEPLLCAIPPESSGTRLVDMSLPKCALLYTMGIPLATFFGFLTAFAASIAGILYKYRSRITYMLNSYDIRKTATGFQEISYSDYAFDAFVCYSGHDSAFVKRDLTPPLEEGPEKYVLCLHERDFPIGSCIIENIGGAIDRSRKIVLVLSEQFMKSQWCKWEMKMAHNKMLLEDEHFMIIIQLGKFNTRRLPRHLRLHMETRTYLEWPASGHGDIKTVFNRLKRGLGKSIFQNGIQCPPKLGDLIEVEHFDKSDSA